MNVSTPLRAESPAMRAMVIGPDRFEGDIQPTIILRIESAVSHVISPVLVTACPIASIGP